MLDALTHYIEFVQKFEELAANESKKDGIQEGYTDPQHQDGPQSPANRVRKREAIIRLPPASRQCFCSPERFLRDSHFKVFPSRHNSFHEGPP